MAPFFRSVCRQASHTPLSSKPMVFFLLAAVCAYSTSEFGRWFEITQRLQNFTSLGSP
jgi:hypothetical protein